MKIWMPILASAFFAAPGAASAEELELFNNRLFVEATVNGLPTKALLDSAAEMSVVDDDFAERLGLVPSGHATAHGSGAEAMEARFVEQVTIESAGARISPRIAVIDLGEVSSRLIGRPVDLLLGRDYFDSQRLRIDLAGGTLDIAEQVPERGVRLPLSSHRGVPTIPVSVSGEPVQAVFDLGNGSEVLLGRAFAERLGLGGPQSIVERKVGGGLGGSIERDIVLLPRLSIAGREYRDVPAAIDDGETAADLNIGTSILRDFTIFTDFPDGAIWLEAH